MPDNVPHAAVAASRTEFVVQVQTAPQTLLGRVAILLPLRPIIQLDGFRQAKYVHDLATVGEDVVDVIFGDTNKARAQLA